MQYVLTNSPIASKRFDRLSYKESKQQRQHRQKRQEKLEKSFSVEELVEQGFYESSDPIIRPYGVEFVNERAERRDQDGEWEVVHSLTVALSLPRLEKLPGLMKLDPFYREKSKSHFWKLTAHYGNANLWSCLDLLDRILDLPCWQEFDSVPLFWTVGTEKLRSKLPAWIEAINAGQFELSYPPVPKISDVKNRALHYSNARVPWNERKNWISRFGVLAYLRHCYTPYDYLWQTAKMPADQAKQLCHSLIEETYPDIVKGR